MRAHLAAASQFYEYADFGSLTARGWSNESEKLSDAEIMSFRDYFDVPASRLHLCEVDGHRSELRVAGQDLGDILIVFRNRIPEGIRERIRRRIGVLLDPTEWDIEDELPNPESFRRLLSFLAAHDDLRHPSIFLNRYGLFTASWRPEKRKLASLVFHADDNANWLVFSPQRGNETDVIETTGRAPLDVVLQEVGKHGALTWMRRPTLIARLLGNA